MIHAKELRKRDDQDVPCGDGDVDFEKVLPMALSNGWEIVVEFESENAEEGVKKSAAHLARWLAP